MVKVMSQSVNEEMCVDGSLYILWSFYYNNLGDSLLLGKIT